MQNRPDILEIMRRGETGEYCTVKDWDVRRVPGAIRKMLKKYDLAKTCDVENPVNSDYELADRFFKAGFDLAVELGMLNESTERIIRVNEEELANAVKFAPSEIFLGEGVDGTWVKTRKPADPYPCKVAASLGITVSEDIFLDLVSGIAREREVDILEAGSIITVHGEEVLSGTPFETLMGHWHGRLHREARRRAGRPGIGAIGSISAVTEYGQFGAYGTPDGFLPRDLALILLPSELKVDYRSFHKIVHTINMGGVMKCDSPSMIGGMAGPPEGAVVSAVAWSLLSYAILQNTVGGGETYDVRYLANVNREGLWALSLIDQALSRNTDTIVHTIANEVSGPMTDKLLYEIAAGMSVIAASGASMTTGPRTSGGKLHDHITPLECRFLAEITHATSGMEPEQVNEIVKQLLPKYEDDLKTPDVGVPYQEAYDMETHTPKQEWEDIYRRVKQEMIDLGIPMDTF